MIEHLVRGFSSYSSSLPASETPATTAEFRERARVERVGYPSDTRKEKSSRNIISKAPPVTPVAGGALVRRPPCTRYLKVTSRSEAPSRLRKRFGKQP